MLQLAGKLPPLTVLTLLLQTSALLGFAVRGLVLGSLSFAVCSWLLGWGLGTQNTSSELALAYPLESFLTEASPAPLRRGLLSVRFLSESGKTHFHSVWRHAPLQKPLTREPWARSLFRSTHVKGIPLGKYPVSITFVGCPPRVRPCAKCFLLNCIAPMVPLTEGFHGEHGDQSGCC